MPNGGYPRHLNIPIVSSPYVLHAHGSTLDLKVKEFPDPESTRFEWVCFGELLPDQVSALLFHLLEWGSNLDVEQIHAIVVDGRHVGPRFTATTCLYDY